MLSFLSVQTNDEDVSQFDTKFTKQTPVDSPDENVLSESQNVVFQVKQMLVFLADFVMSFSLVYNNIRVVCPPDIGLLTSNYFVHQN